MGTMTEVFVVTHGEYSDYCVECVFEREQDAKTYADLANVADVRGEHDGWSKSELDSRWYREQRELHAQPFDECEACKREVEAGAGRYGAYRVERFAFHPAGEIPHGDAKGEPSV